MAKDLILELAFNHVVLPPKLPGKQDGNIEDVEKKLFSLILRGTNAMKSCAGDDDLFIWQDIEKALRTCGHVNKDRYVNKTALMNIFHHFEDENAVILHITEQNTGLLIRSVG